MEEPCSLAMYVEKLAGRAEAEAMRLAPNPMLVQVSDELGAPQQGFHTAFLDRRGAQITATTDPSKREVFSVRKRGDGVFGGHISVGRTQNLDVAIVRAGISKFHAFFSQDGQGRYQLTDKESKNGTFVDGERLAPGEAQRIQDGDQIRFASHAFLFMQPLSFVRFVATVRLQAPRR